MALTSSSTLSDALAQYNDNLAWDGNITKAAAALEAVRFILMNRPQRLDDGHGRSVNYTAFEEEKKKLEEYVNRNSTAVNRASFVRGKMRL